MLARARENSAEVAVDCGKLQETFQISWLLRVFPMPRTVLIVDEERDSNDILASLVRARHFEPIQVYSGAQVWPVVSVKKPELILLDLMLPDVDGFAICDQLKRNRQT